MNMKNSLQKRTPVQNLQMAVGTACAMGTATMLSTVMAYADVSTAIDKVFNVGSQVSNSIAKGLTNVVVPIGIAVFLYLLVRMLLASDPKDVQTYKKRLIVVAIIVVAATRRKQPIRKGRSFTNQGTRPKNRYHTNRIRGSIPAITVSLLP